MVEIWPLWTLLINAKISMKKLKNLKEGGMAGEFEN